jgi:hypothetical protein
VNDSKPLPALKPWEYINTAGGVSICRWCQAELGVVPSMNESHGICREHLQRQLDQLANVHANRGQEVGK